MPYADLEVRRAFHRRYMKQRRTTELGKTEDRKVYMRRYYAQPHTRLAMRDRNLRRQYGITLEQYEEMKVKQGNKCLICERDFNSTPHTDHHHESGKVRGLLCGTCNKGLGQFKDNPVLLRKAAAYLEIHT